MSEIAKSLDISNVEKASTRGSDDEIKTVNHATREPNIVDWDGPNDPENPMNWPTSKKCGAVGLVSLITLLSCVSLDLFFGHSLPGIGRSPRP